MSMKKKKAAGIETLKSRYGTVFSLPWLIGMALFFVIPIVLSVWYSLSDLKLDAGKVSVMFTGLKNYKHLIHTDPKYMKNLISGISSIFSKVPFILVLSMILGMFLNNKFIGRVFFRSLFFLPVIISSGVVLDLFLEAAQGDATAVAGADTLSFGMMDFSKLLEGLSLPPNIQQYLAVALDSLFMLIWQSGIQIVLIIAGLQTIPDLLYEVAEVEGATKWEQFWFITLPMMIRTILIVLIYTIVEAVTIKTNQVIRQGYNFFYNLEYGLGSAALWLYFMLVAAIIAIVLFLFSKVFLKKWG